MKAIDTTLCLTIGKRPELLRQTLNSLITKIKFEHIIAINDFNDDATNAVFRELCPQGQLITLGVHVGHHAAIDYMYSQVKTKYIFHCEDDWFFEHTPNIESYKAYLNQYRITTCISLRQWSDFHYDDSTAAQLKFEDNPFFQTVRMDHMHEQWHGYSFNPHFAPKALWQSFAGGFSKFKKERHISRHLRSKNRMMIYLADGLCYHIGQHDSIANPPPKNWLTKLNAKVFG